MKIELFVCEDCKHILAEKVWCCAGNVKSIGMFERVKEKREVALQSEYKLVAEEIARWGDKDNELVKAAMRWFDHLRKKKLKSKGFYDRFMFDMGECKKYGKNAMGVIEIIDYNIGRDWAKIFPLARQKAQDKREEKADAALEYFVDKFKESE